MTKTLPARTLTNWGIVLLLICALTSLSGCQGVRLDRDHVLHVVHEHPHRR
ncbi:MAG: hypothetical protein HQL52_20145 [Magnetococcales bacterium]|nr:hypothetical protein [Magnetococcales bacterium]